MFNPNDIDIQADIDFLTRTADQIEAQGHTEDAILEGVARFRLLAERLGTLRELMEGLIEQFINPALASIPEDYHCGDKNCEACNEANGK